MTVYEAMVKEQSHRCNLIEMYFKMLGNCDYVNEQIIKRYQESIDRAYLLGIAIDNLRCDIATMEV